MTLALMISSFHCQCESIAEAKCIGIENEILQHQGEPCVIVIFGATGDLTARKLFPAIYHLAHEGYLAKQTAVVGFARGNHTSERFAEQMSQALDRFSRTKPKDEVFWDQFKDHIFYHQSEFEDDLAYQRLQQLLAKIDEEMGTQGNRVYYLATPPNDFLPIVEKLSQHRLIYDPQRVNGKWSRVLIEKPFGYDLDSAIELQEQLSKYLAESQIYRIDHYLGKEGVQNLLTLRFENALFEPLWNHQYIDNIQITLAEDIGIGSRASFWEKTGSLRDVFQNHLMQLLAIVAMEVPPHLDAASIRAERIKVLNAIRPFSLSQIESDVIRGQYASGIIQGVAVPGYREEKNVADKSPVETFVAARLFIDNPRWRGVPFYIRAGKRLAKQVTEIAITFKKSPFSSHQEPNVLFIRIQPHPGIFLRTISKVPGLHKFIQPVVFGYQPDAVFGQSSPEAYEKLISDCIRGDSQLFVAVEEQLAAWRLLTPILEYWKDHAPTDFPNYEAGTWGPSAADHMLMQNGHQWQLLENE
jgi:glucose-6-phosphate 1-dehydrogenase